MLVRDYMTKHPIMISPEALVTKAQQIIVENKVRHLPVVTDGKRLVGLVTRNRLNIPPSDLTSFNVWEISRILSKLKVKDVMVKQEDLVTIHQEAVIEDAAAIMCRNKIGCLPVVDEDGIVIGIISEIDLLAELSSILGGGVKGVRVTIRVPDKVGEFAKVTTAIASKGWGIYSSGGVPAPKTPDYWDMVLKVRNVTIDELAEVLKKIEGQEIRDIREIRA
ncbi:MAG: CBS domain-containing protein [Anaerolineales bacterium]|jgi:acetoin utilization protein AcuB